MAEYRLLQSITPATLRMFQDKGWQVWVVAGVKSTRCFASFRDGDMVVYRETDNLAGFENHAGPYVANYGLRVDYPLPIPYTPLVAYIVLCREGLARPSDFDELLRTGTQVGHSITAPASKPAPGSSRPRRDVGIQHDDRRPTVGVHAHPVIDNGHQVEPGISTLQGLTDADMEWIGWHFYVVDGGRVFRYSRESAGYKVLQEQLVKTDDARSERTKFYLDAHPSTTSECRGRRGISGKWTPLGPFDLIIRSRDPLTTTRINEMFSLPGRHGARRKKRS